ncbi:MAG: type II toxin-antitoxin system RelE/ParE family toxin [Bacteroidetes bacterium]|nr:type II toxin-antitoxin system RelE/ParE family toxin [Bacteroidota bacterium]
MQLTKTYPQLKDQPHYGSNIKKLKNYIPETWRYLIGNYRVFYEINDNEKIVYIIGISTRQSAY